MRWVKRTRRRIARRLLRIVQEPNLPEESVAVPYDRSHPVIYDKDWVVNCYTDDYLMALAASGEIELRGMTTSSSIAPFNPEVTEEQFEQIVRDRETGVNIARHSGMCDLPRPLRGTKGHLRRPDSGVIEETQPLESDGSWFIVEQARQTRPEKPLVLVMGGPLTIAADAFLLDPRVADRVIVAWFGGRWDHLGDYNGCADPWAAYIVATRMTMCRFPAVRVNGCWPSSPLVPHCLLRRLPETPLRQWMLDKRHSAEQPGGFDADAPPAIALMRSDYAVAGCRMSCCGWRATARPDRRLVPALKPDPQGSMLVVTSASQNIATQEWWRALSNPRAYAGAFADAELCSAEGASL